MGKKEMKWYDWIFGILIGVALVNWGLVAWFDFNLVEAITFDVGWLATTVYSIVAVLGLVGLVNLVRKAL